LSSERGSQLRPTSDFPYDHYSLLRTIEEAFELGTLGLEDTKAVPIGGIWASSGSPERSHSREVRRAAGAQ